MDLQLQGKVFGGKLIGEILRKTTPKGQNSPNRLCKWMIITIRIIEFNYWVSRNALVGMYVIQLGNCSHVVDRLAETTLIGAVSATWFNHQTYICWQQCHNT